MDDYGVRVELGFTPTPLPASLADRLMDQISALDTLSEDLLDWTVGADLNTGTVEVDLTIASTDPGTALARGQELLRTAVRMLELSPRTKALSAELV